MTSSHAWPEVSYFCQRLFSVDVVYIQFIIGKHDHVSKNTGYMARQSSSNLVLAYQILTEPGA